MSPGGGAAGPWRPLGARESARHEPAGGPGAHPSPRRTEDRPRRPRRRAGCVRPSRRGFVCGDRSCGRPRQGHRQRNRDSLLACRVGSGSGQAIAHQVLGAGHWLRRPSAERTDREVCCGAARKAHSATWAADVGHCDPFSRSPSPQCRPRPRTSESSHFRSQLHAQLFASRRSSPSRMTSSPKRNSLS